MAMRLIFKRVLLAVVLYSCGVEIYALLNAFYGKRQELNNIKKEAIAIETMPARTRAVREEIIEDVVDFYNLDVRWRHFHESFNHDDPLFFMQGIGTVKRYHRIAERYLLTPDCTGKLNSVTHYQSAMLLDIDTTSVTKAGNFCMKMHILLELANFDESEKIVHMQEEWNAVPLMFAKNTKFPVGLSAEILRVLCAKLMLQLDH